ncbi:hypothetical protein ABFV83_08105 [Lacrimispora sp. BS-2]|uniref:Uncharacterized protein n=1 Tax=Lacrimispora sp. BS-2 TaxID=3151850 RepID=A0AAU7PTP1_9FIRM
MDECFQFFHTAFFNHFSSTDDAYLVANGFHFRKNVAVEKHCLSRSPHLLDALLEYALHQRIEAGCGFVEDKLLHISHKKSVEKKPIFERSEEDKAMLEMYGKQIDFTDQSTMEPLVAYVTGVTENR